MIGRYLSLLTTMVICGTQSYSVMERVDIEQLTVRSHTIVVGRIVSVRSILGDRGEIVTLVAIAPTDAIKGNVESSIVLTIPGGVVGEIGLFVEDTPQFSVGEEVLLFVNDDYRRRKTVTEWHQGKYAITNGNTFVGGTEVSVKSLVSGIRAFISQGERGKIQFEQIERTPSRQGMNPELVPSINYLTPSSGSALRPFAINPNNPFNPGDRGTIIDIYGSGFGSTQGTGVVRFYEVPFSEAADAEDYLLWSDTRITCKVPGRQWDTGLDKFLNASSGLAYVVTSGGTSNGVQFTVTFAAPNKRFLILPVTYYINQNGTPDADGEFQAIQDAFQSWENVSNSNLDWTYGGTTARIPSHETQDFYNDCIWLESSWPFASSAIAVNNFWFSGIASSNAALESDIFFNGQNFFWTTTGDPTRRDVQNIATHESGHSLNLQDIYGNADIAKTMYGYSGSGETSKRSLESEDISGCIYTYPDPFSLSLFNTFEFDGTSGGQVTVRNISQATNTITYSAPQNRQIYYGAQFEFGALSQQTVNSRDYRFVTWTDGFESLNRTVTVANPITLSPSYKGHLLSSNPTATGANNQRKIARDNSGTYHFAYESGGKIWYSNSTDNGSTWSTDEQLFPIGYPSAYPSITSHDNYIFVVWQDYEGVVNGMHQYRIRGAWKDPAYDWDPIIFDENTIARFASQIDPLPSLAAADNTVNEIPQYEPYHPELMVAWRNSDGIYSAVGHWNTIGSQVYMWREDIRFGLVSGTNGSSLRPSLGTDFLSRIVLAYEESGKIYAKLNDGAGWLSRETVSSTQVYDQEYHKTPSVTVDNSSRPIVSWSFSMVRFRRVGSMFADAKQMNRGVLSQAS